MTDPTAVLERYLDDRLGDHAIAEVTPMAGGGSCEIFAITRGAERWVLRRAPRHASSATAHDVLREFRILDAIKATSVPIATPILACDDPAVFGSPFYVMERVDGVPIRSGVPATWADAPETHGQALEQHIDALVAIHAVDWQSCGLAELAHTENYLQRQIGRWLRQLDSYGGRELPAAHTLAEWLESGRPSEQPPALFHGDYKLDNVLFATSSPPRLLAVVDWEMAGIGDPLAATGAPVLQAGSSSAELVDGLVAEPGDIRLDKHRMSGFWDTALDSILRNLRVDTLLFAGVNADQCVLSTLTDAACLGYDVVMVEDACATTSPPFCWEATVYNVRQCFGFTLLAADVVAALGERHP